MPSLTTNAIISFGTSRSLATSLLASFKATVPAGPGDSDQTANAEQISPLNSTSSTTNNSMSLWVMSVRRIFGDDSIKRFTAFSIRSRSIEFNSARLSA